MALPKQVWTETEYLAMERASDVRHEFHQGEIFAMVGASPNHVLTTTNTSSSLNLQLRKTPCRVYQSDLRVKIGITGLYTYPDITVVCGEPFFSDDTPDNLLNPTLIIEVLSPSTEQYDRGKKFQHYRSLESLQEYVLISQDAPHVERFLRQADSEWLFKDRAGLDAVLALSSIECTLALADVYEKITFPTQADQE